MFNPLKAMLLVSYTIKCRLWNITWPTVCFCQHTNDLLVPGNVGNFWNTWQLSYSQELHHMYFITRQTANWNYKYRCHISYSYSYSKHM